MQKCDERSRKGDRFTNSCTALYRAFTPFALHAHFRVAVASVPALDLSFPRFDREAELTVLPGDLAVLIVGIAARQAASPTAAVQAGFARAHVDPKLFSPLHGAFNGPMAEALTRWKDE